MLHDKYVTTNTMDILRHELGSICNIKNTCIFHKYLNSDCKILEQNYCYKA